MQIPEQPPVADKSAVDAINRPLRMGFCSFSIFGRIAYVKWIDRKGIDSNKMGKGVAKGTKKKENPS
jgi:hypothetical protein